MLQRLARSREVITSIRLRNGAVTLMVAAIFVNLVQLNISPSGSGFKPFPKYDTADITKIAERKGKTKARYGLFFELGRKFPGSTFIVPRSSEVEPAFVAAALSYGRAAHVTLSPFDAKAFSSDLELESMVAKGKDDKQGDPFVIVPGSNSNVFVVLRHQGKTVLIDLSLLVRAQDPSRD